MRASWTRKGKARSIHAGYGLDSCPGRVQTVLLDKVILAALRNHRGVLILINSLEDRLNLFKLVRRQANESVVQHQGVCWAEPLGLGALVSRGP